MLVIHLKNSSCSKKSCSDVRTVPEIKEEAQNFTKIPIQDNVFQRGAVFPVARSRQSNTFTVYEGGYCPVCRVRVGSVSLWRVWFGS